MCGLAGAHGSEGAVAHALAAAARPEPVDAEEVQDGQATAAAAGRACRDALRAATDALAASGTAA
eukprot:4378507-Pleurochrysis_carterae.AAC.1